MTEKHYFILSIIDWVFFAYFIVLGLVYFTLLTIAAFKVLERKKEQEKEDLLNILSSQSFPEISFIVPIYNEEQNVLKTIHNLKHLSYRHKQIILVNDGSTDGTFALIKENLDLKEIPKSYDEPLPTQEIRNVYVSRKWPEFVLIDKVNGGGKFDALNAGINATYSQYFIVIDADTFIDDRSFLAFVRPLLTDPTLIAVGASIKLGNDCLITPNGISTKTFPKRILPAFQTFEYMRCFLGRQGWDFIGGNVVLAGAFSIFKKEQIVEIGGYVKTVAEDMEIVIRLHRMIKLTGAPYKIKYFPDPVAWTLGPDTLKELGKQRARWHRGLLDCIWFHKNAFLRKEYGVFGLFVYPFWVFGEAIEPVIELLGILYICILWLLGRLPVHFLLLFAMVLWGFMVLFTAFCMLIEEFSFNRYRHFRPTFYLFFLNAVEFIGYRQLNLLWRLKGFWLFFKDFSFVQNLSDHVDKLMKRPKKGFFNEDSIISENSR